MRIAGFRPGLRSRVARNRTGSREKAHQNSSAPARNPLNFRFDNPLDQSGQIIVEPGFQHRPQHFLDQVFQRPRVVAEHGIGKAVEGGFDRRHRRTRQDLRRRRGAFKRRRFVRRSPRRRFCGTGLGEFEVFLRVDLLERRRRIGGNAISSVNSNTSGSDSGWGGRISFAEVASSRPDSKASMSSWLLGAAATPAGLTGDGAGAAAGLAAAACAVGIADGGIPFIAASLPAAASGLSGFAEAAGAVAFSATAGFASSSAMMRRIDAKISSIEGSWTFAGCVISGLHIINALAAFYTKQDEIGRLRIGGPGFSSLQPDLSPDQVPRSPCPSSGHLSVAFRHDTRCGANRLAALSKGTSGQQLIASNGRRVIVDAVIPGCAAWRRPEIHNHRSEVDSGLAPRRAPRNDKIICRPACGRRPSYRAPAGNARLGHRWSSRA